LRADKVRTKERVVVVVSGKKVYDSGGSMFRRLLRLFRGRRI
jgi:hypothetical protein